MEEFMPIAGQFFMREQKINGVTVTMVMGIIPEKLISTTIDDSELLKGGPADELWRMQFIPVDVVKYKVPTKYAGYEANSIFVEGPKVSECKKI